MKPLRRRIDLESEEGQRILREAGLAAVTWYEDHGDDCHFCFVSESGVHDETCPLAPLSKTGG